MTVRRRLDARTVAAGMLGFASALPFVFLTGTLAAWFSELGISMTTIGLLSSITLAYGFKLLWAPLVKRALHRWMAVCQLGLAIGFAALASLDPQNDLNRFALTGFAAALLSATFDTAFEAWRVRVADEETPVEVIMTASQIGARVAVLLAGAGALWLSALVGWDLAALGLACLFALLAAVILIWPAMRVGSDADDPAPGDAGTAAGQQLVAVACAVAGLGIAIWQVVGFIARISSAPGDQQAQVEAFITLHGPLILAMITVVPILASRMGKRFERRLSHWSPDTGTSRRLREAYDAVVAPFEELAERFGLRLVLVFVFVAIYTLSWFSWAGFTLPLYLRELGFTMEEVAAARLYGSLPTAIGILVGGIALLKLPRRQALLVGALLPLVANATYIDLALGGTALRGAVDLFAAALQSETSDDVEHWAPLYLSITLKNLTSGIASAIFVGFLASLVNPRFASVQCAIFSSLSFVTGTIVSAAAGSLIDAVGFARMLEYASLFALVAAISSLSLSGAFYRQAPR